MQASSFHALHPVILAASALLFVSAGAPAAEMKTKNPAPAAAEAKDNAGLRAFLHSTKGTYGWSPVKGTISYDFFPDGRVHIQGPDGEASMAEGRWTLNGDVLIITEKESRKTTKLRAQRKGEDLLLGEQRYRRYRP